MASHLLAELGADVIKIENPRTGDGNRGTAPFVHGVGNLHVSLNSGTRSLTVDLRSPEGPRIVEACARWADAVIVGARPLDSKRRGLDFATFAKANPRIVYCSLSGFGDAGPWQNYTAHGQTMDALAGLVRLEPGDGPPRTATGWRSSGTPLGGVFAAMGVLAALNRRLMGLEHAQFVSVSIWASAMWWQWRDITMLSNTGEMWHEYSDLGSRYCMYRTQDARVLLVAPIEQRFWTRFCDLVGMPEDAKEHGDWAASGMDFGKGPAYDAERAEITRLMLTRPLNEWINILSAQDIPFAPVLTPQEALASQHAVANGVMRGSGLDGRDIEVPAIPIRFAEDTDNADPILPPVSPPPGLGEQNAEILQEFGLGELAATRR
jgi:crotonobetainyl-CoA:carnitine CoA-transferase CaiB-like acyl-CoA transferase